MGIWTPNGKHEFPGGMTAHEFVASVYRAYHLQVQVKPGKVDPAKWHRFWEHLLEGDDERR